jgi:hypothetical protein
MAPFARHKERMTLTQVRALIASRPAAVAVAVIGNLIPAAGVAFLGWSASQILILYWMENVILGVLTIPRIIAAGRGRPESLGVALFFVVHYGLFCLGHLIFVVVLVAGLVSGGDDLVADADDGRGFYLAILAVALLHLVSQIREWWMPKLWHDAAPAGEMFRPYGRIFVLHLTVLLGAWLILGTGAPAATILLLCVLKLVLELIMIGISGVNKALTAPPG